MSCAYSIWNCLTDLYFAPIRLLSIVNQLFWLHIPRLFQTRHLIHFLELHNRCSAHFLDSWWAPNILILQAFLLTSKKYILMKIWNHLDWSSIRYLLIYNSLYYSSKFVYCITSVVFLHHTCHAYVKIDSISSRMILLLPFLLIYRIL